MLNKSQAKKINQMVIDANVKNGINDLDDDSYFICLSSFSAVSNQIKDWDSNVWYMLLCRFSTTQSMEDCGSLYLTFYF